MEPMGAQRRIGLIGYEWSWRKMDGQSGFLICLRQIDQILSDITNLSYLIKIGGLIVTPFLVGHSSGAVAILGLLQTLPKETKVDSCYLVGAFKNDLGWESLKDLFETPFNFDLIKTKANRFVFIHSDDDPYCPLDHAEFLSHKLGGELVIKTGQKHFSIGTFGEAYRRFPYLLNKILEDKKSI